MFGMSVRTEDRFDRVKKAADSATFRNLGHAAASIAKDARQSIERSPEASQPGSPPHTRRGQLKRAFRYAAEKESAVVGPLFSMVGTSAAAHEFGEDYKGIDYPERPFMQPALDRALPRFMESWSGAITE